MQFQGKIDFKKPVTINGKPHGVEHASTLAVWTTNDAGRVVHAEDTSKLWLGGSAAWLELTPGGIGAHNHNDLYFTITQLETSGQSQVNWGNLASVPSTYPGNATPTSHGNEHHSSTYIAASDVTFTILSANGVVGTGATQVSIGTHTHSGYEPAISPKNDAFNASFSGSGSAVTVSHSDHDHSGTYEPAITVKNSGFNVSLGTAHADAAYGDHAHAGAYEPVIAVKNSGFNVSFSGSGSSATVSHSDHNHSGTYEPEIASKKSAFNVDFGASHATAAYGDHAHDLSAYSTSATLSASTGAALVGAAGITGITPTGGASEGNGTVQAMLEGIAVKVPASKSAGDTGIGYIIYNGTTQSSGRFDGSSTLPSHNDWLNYDGILRVTGIEGKGVMNNRNNSDPGDDLTLGSVYGGIALQCGTLSDTAIYLQAAGGGIKLLAAADKNILLETMPGNGVISLNGRVTMGSLVLPLADSDPSSPVEGQIYHNTTSHTAYVYDGSAWKALW